MTTARRWCVVAVGVALLVALPVAVRLLPAHSIDISAADLLAKAQASTGVAYAGYVESRGTLSLPVASQFSDVAELFGERTTMRVWWRGADDWRVDKLTPSGEVDLFHDPLGTTRWDYEADRAERTLNARVRLPRTSDLLPPELARRMLTDAHRGEVTRIDSARIAGVDAAGLRLRPSEPASSVDHVDVWVEPATGLPLSVAIFAKGDDLAALTSTFLDVSTEVPVPADTAFSLPPGAELRYESVADIAAAANRFAPLRAPATLAGLSRQDTGLGAVGVYGRGVTELVAIPLWQPAADPLRKQLAVTPGASVGRSATTLAVGPLNLLLSNDGYADHSWLLTGTVTSQTLVEASGELASQTPRLRVPSLVVHQRPR